MKGWEELEGKVRELFGTMEHLASENRRLGERFSSSEERRTQLELNISELNKTLREFETKIKSLEEEKSVAIQHQENSNEEKYSLKRKNLEFQKIAEMARLKVEDVLNKIERLEMERRG